MHSGARGSREQILRRFGGMRGIDGANAENLQGSVGEIH